ncbi:MAG: QcrA and Rieske domain-containing protein [Planctomycetota bacterium]|jgi:Rieske Fe-S protein
MAELSGPVSRRNWLLWILNTGIATTLAAVFYPVVRFLWPRAATVSGAQQVIAPFRVSQLPNAQGNPFNFGGKPCLVVLSPDGAKRLARGEPLRPDDVKAFDATCTHTDCTVEYRPDKGDIVCHCHDGVYDLNGRNVSGPPPRPLEAYKVTLSDKEEIVVSRST